MNVLIRIISVVMLIVSVFFLTVLGDYNTAIIYFLSAIYINQESFRYKSLLKKPKLKRDVEVDIKARTIACGLYGLNYTEEVVNYIKKELLNH